MTRDERSFLERELRDVIAQYRAQGYDVFREGVPKEIAKRIGDFTPDFVALRGDEVVIIEVKNAKNVDQVQLGALADVISRYNNWRLELVWLGKEVSDILSRQQIRDTVTRVQEVARIDLQAALLIAWSAAEAALALLLSDAELDLPSNASAGRMLATAESLGIISDRQYAALFQTLDIRNRVAHGRTAEVTTEMLDSLREATLSLAHEGYASVDQMIDWFHEHYKNPADGVTYDSREGGYQYLNPGEPYDALEVLDEQFPGADPQDREEAARLLVGEAHEWVRNDEY